MVGLAQVRHRRWTGVGGVAALLFLRSPSARAQQNFFNVPASDVTAPGKVFFQEQVNVLTTQKKLQSNSHFCFGLGSDFEVGFNFSHLNIKPFDRTVIPVNTRNRAEPFNPLLLATAQKSTNFDGHVQLALGTQTGINVGGPVDATRLATLTYVNIVVLVPKPHARIVVGGYYGNDVFLGAGAGPGIWVGAELQVIAQRVHLVADWISGSHDLGLGVAGANVFFTRDISLVFGPILPNPRSGNGTGYVIELNVLDLAGALRAVRSAL